MGAKHWLVRCGFTASVAGAALLLGACTRPGAGGTETPTVGATARASVTIARTATRTASPIAPSAAPSTSAAPVATATIAPPPATATVPAGGGKKYVVQSGDTLSGIAEQFGVTIQQIIDANSLQNPDLLLPGQELIIPAP
ncbi:MAG TPA: LysM peptidoglycan-binding domain-containing protein [Thermomicrobiales bacterium]